MATISHHLVRAALVGASRQGHAPHQLLIRAGINPKLIELEHARVNDNQMARLIQLIWSLLADEFMGFTANPCKQGAFAYMSHSIRRCDNLREALASGLRFYNLLTDDIHSELSEATDSATINLVFSHPELDPDHFYQQFWMVIWHRLASWLTGIRIPLLQATLSCQQPQHSDELRHMFPCAHHFNGSSNQLSFAAEHLNLPLIRSRQEVDLFLLQSPFDLLSIPGFDRSLQHKISRMLSAGSSANLYFPPLQELAQQLNLTPQTLHRRLQREATSYQQIKDRIRRDTALSKLIREKMPVYQVAEVVGFADARSFTRAFKQWTGLSPREYCRFI